MFASQTVSEDPWGRVLKDLTADRPALVDDFVERLTASHFYSSYNLPPEELREAANGAMDLLIGMLAGHPLSQELRDLPVRVGIRRARQGVAREHLMEAVRLDLRVLWSGLLRACREQAPDLLVLHTESLLTAVESYASDVQAAYLAERSRMDSDSQARIWKALSRLLTAGANTGRVAEEVAPALGFTASGTFEVAVVIGEELTTRRLLQDETRRHFVHWDLDDATAFIREVRGVADWPATLPNATGAYITGVTGLAAVPAAIDAAYRFAQVTIPKLGLLTTETAVWPAVAHIAVSDSVPHLATARSRARKLLERDGDPVLRTVFEFAATGSVKATSAALFCHRNTVMNRLDAFRELTSFDMLRPDDAARALIAFGPEYSAFLQRRS